jgi:hypothetical protein
LSWIAANPAAELTLLARKAWYALSNVFLTLNYSYPFYARDIGSPLGLLIVGPTLLLALGAVGLTVRSRGTGRPGSSPCSPSPPCSPCLLFFVAARVPDARSRGLVVAAAGASWADRSLAQARAWKPMVAAGLIASAASVVAAWPTGLDNGRTEEQVRMGLYEIDRGRVAEGERWISNALNTYGHPFPRRRAPAHRTGARGGRPQCRSARALPQGDRDRS